MYRVGQDLVDISEFNTNMKCRMVRVAGFQRNGDGTMMYMVNILEETTRDGSDETTVNPYMLDNSRDIVDIHQGAISNMFAVDVTKKPIQIAQWDLNELLPQSRISATEVCVRTFVYAITSYLDFQTLEYRSTLLTANDRCKGVLKAENVRKQFTVVFTLSASKWESFDKVLKCGIERPVVRFNEFYAAQVRVHYDYNKAEASLKFEVAKDEGN